MLTWQRTSATSVAMLGILNRKTLHELLPVAKRLQEFSGTLNVELADLEQVDTAGLAFLIEIKQAADKKQLQLNFSGTTSALDKLISLHNAQSLLA